MTTEKPKRGRPPKRRTMSSVDGTRIVSLATAEGVFLEKNFYGREWRICVRHSGFGATVVDVFDIDDLAGAHGRLAEIASLL